MWSENSLEAGSHGCLSATVTVLTLRWEPLDVGNHWKALSKEVAWAALSLSGIPLLSCGQQVVRGQGTQQGQREALARMQQRDDGGGDKERVRDGLSLEAELTVFWWLGCAVGVRTSKMKTGPVARTPGSRSYQFVHVGRFATSLTCTGDLALCSLWALRVLAATV